MRTEATNVNILLHPTRIYENISLNNQFSELRIVVLSTIHRNNIIHHGSILQFNLIMTFINHIQWYFIFVWHSILRLFCSNKCTLNFAKSINNLIQWTSFLPIHHEHMLENLLEQRKARNWIYFIVNIHFFNLSQ